MSNVYYSPEEWALEIVDTLEQDEAYQFNMLIVWKDVETDDFFWATDSGCSCPSPFEDYNHRDDLGDPLSDENFTEFEQDAMGIVGTGVSEEDAQQFVQDIRMAWKGKR